MSPRDHLVYWFVPTAVTMVLVLMFFSGNPVLAAWVAPPISRELGLLENLQAATLLVAIGFALTGWRRAASATERLVFAALAAVLTLLVLEEINYGEHFWKFVSGQSLVPRGRGQELNLHNKISTSPIKTAANVVLLLGFVILPLAVSQHAPAWLRYITPRRALITTVLASVAVSRMAHALDEISGDPGHALGNNIAEFREAFIYYIGLLYVADLALRRRWPGWRRLGDISRSFVR